MNGLAHLEVEELAEVLVLGRNRSTGVDRRSTGEVRISSGCPLELQRSTGGVDRSTGVGAESLGSYWSCNGRPTGSGGRPMGAESEPFFWLVI